MLPIGAHEEQGVIFELRLQPFPKPGNENIGESNAVLLFISN